MEFDQRKCHYQNFYTRCTKFVQKFGVTENKVIYFNRVNMYRKGFYIYCKEYEKLEKRQQCVVTCSM